MHFLLCWWELFPLVALELLNDTLNATVHTILQIEIDKVVVEELSFLQAFDVAGRYEHLLNQPKDE